jgi:hypothetical protein
VVGTGALLMGVVLSLSAIPRGFSWLKQDRAELESRAVVVGRIHADLSGMDALADSVARARAELMGLDSLILEAHTSIGAFAEMSLRMRALADRYALRLEETTQQPDSATAPPFRRVQIRASFEGDSRSLLSSLQALATEMPVLAVNDLSVKTNDPAGSPEVLDVEVAVTGWYLARDGEP